MATGREQVAPGQTVASNWGNDVWDQSVQCFTNGADRDNQYPSPHPGSVAYMEDTQLLVIFVPGYGWTPVAPQVYGTGLIPFCRINAYTVPVSTNENGDGNTVFPVPFPNALVTCQLTSAGAAGLGPVTLTLTQQFSDRRRATFHVSGTDGRPVPDASVGVTLLAIGW